MANANILYCYSRKEDSEKLTNDIKNSLGNLGYCTVKVFGGMYSVWIKGKMVKPFSPYEDVLSFILRKFW